MYLFIQRLIVKKSNGCGFNFLTSLRNAIVIVFIFRRCLAASTEWRNGAVRWINCWSIANYILASIAQKFAECAQFRVTRFYEHDSFSTFFFRDKCIAIFIKTEIVFALLRYNFFFPVIEMLNILLLRFLLLFLLFFMTQAEKKPHKINFAVSILIVI